MRDPKERLRDILQASRQSTDTEPASGASSTRTKCSKYGSCDTYRLLARRRGMAPDIPWNKIIGMRNILVHGYFTMDLDIVWDAVQQDVPLLKPAVVALLKQLEAQA